MTSENSRIVKETNIKKKAKEMDQKEFNQILITAFSRFFRISAWYPRIFSNAIPV